MSIIPMLVSQLSPLGFDWYILIGGFVPAFASIAIALVIWLRRGKEE